MGFLYANNWSWSIYSNFGLIPHGRKLCGSLGRQAWRLELQDGGGSSLGRCLSLEHTWRDELWQFSLSASTGIVCSSPYSASNKTTSSIVSVWLGMMPAHHQWGCRNCAGAGTLDLAGLESLDLPSREGTRSFNHVNVPCFSEPFSRGPVHYPLINGQLIAPTAFVFPGTSFVGSCVLFSSVIPGRMN